MPTSVSVGSRRAFMHQRGRRQRRCAEHAQQREIAVVSGDPAGVAVAGDLQHAAAFGELAVGDAHGPHAVTTMPVPYSILLRDGGPISAITPVPGNGANALSTPSAT